MNKDQEGNLAPQALSALKKNQNRWQGNLGEVESDNACSLRVPFPKNDTWLQAHFVRAGQALHTQRRIGYIHHPQVAFSNPHWEIYSPIKKATSIGLLVAFLLLLNIFRFCKIFIIEIDKNVYTANFNVYGTLIYGLFAMNTTHDGNVWKYCKRHLFHYKYLLLLHSNNHCYKN